MFVNKSNKHKDVLRFIELYRNHEVLWNMNLSSYRRNDLKLKAYESIAAVTKLSVENVKKKIKSLRTAYSAEKSKVENSKNSDTEPLYIPSVFWYNDMEFLDSFLNRRKTGDNSNQGDVNTLAETSVDSKVKVFSFSESYPSSSKKRKHSPVSNSKLDDALEKIIAINKDLSGFETFGKSIGRQIKEFPEEEAYQIMADIQSMITKRKMDALTKKIAVKANKIMSSKSVVSEYDSDSIEINGRIDSQEEFEGTSYRNTSTKKNSNVDSITIQNELIEKARSLLSEKTQSSTVTIYWSEKLKKLKPKQRMFAEKAINDILFEAELGILNKDAIQMNQYSTSTVTSPEPNDEDPIGYDMQESSFEFQQEN